MAFKNWQQDTTKGTLTPRRDIYGSKNVLN